MLKRAKWLNSFMVYGHKNIKLPFYSLDSLLSEYIIFKIFEKYLLINKGENIQKST